MKTPRFQRSLSDRIPNSEPPGSALNRNLPNRGNAQASTALSALTQASLALLEQRNAPAPAPAAENAADVQVTMDEPGVSEGSTGLPPSSGIPNWHGDETPGNINKCPALDEVSQLKYSTADHGVLPQEDAMQQKDDFQDWSTRCPQKTASTPGGVIAKDFMVGGSSPSPQSIELQSALNKTRKLKKLGERIMRTGSCNVTAVSTNSVKIKMQSTSGGEVVLSKGCRIWGGNNGLVTVAYECTDTSESPDVDQISEEQQDNSRTIMAKAVHTSLNVSSIEETRTMTDTCDGEDDCYCNYQDAVLAEQDDESETYFLARTNPYESTDISDYTLAEPTEEMMSSSCAFSGASTPVTSTTAQTTSDLSAPKSATSNAKLPAPGSTVNGCQHDAIDGRIERYFLAQTFNPDGSTDSSDYTLAEPAEETMSGSCALSGATTPVTSTTAHTTLDSSVSQCTPSKSFSGAMSPVTSAIAHSTSDLSVHQSTHSKAVIPAPGFTVSVPSSINDCQLKEDFRTGNSSSGIAEMDDRGTHFHDAEPQNGGDGSIEKFFPAKTFNPDGSTDSSDYTLAEPTEEMMTNSNTSKAGPSSSSQGGHRQHGAKCSGLSVTSDIPFKLPRLDRDSGYAQSNNHKWSRSSMCPCQPSPSPSTQGEQRLHGSKRSSSSDTSDISAKSARLDGTSTYSSLLRSSTSAYKNSSSCTRQGEHPSCGAKSSSSSATSEIPAKSVSLDGISRDSQYSRVNWPRSSVSTCKTSPSSSSQSVHQQNGTNSSTSSVTCGNLAKSVKLDGISRYSQYNESNSPWSSVNAYKTSLSASSQDGHRPHGAKRSSSSATSDIPAKSARLDGISRYSRCKRSYLSNNKHNLTLESNQDLAPKKCNDMRVCREQHGEHSDATEPPTFNDLTEGGEFSYDNGTLASDVTSADALGPAIDLSDGEYSAGPAGMMMKVYTNEEGKPVWELSLQFK